MAASGILEVQPMATTCASDWTKCVNNGEMANGNIDWISANVACKFAANDRAKYGNPEWPSLTYFENFYPGTNYITTGIATLIEPDVKFQNGFGAMVRSSVFCEYDLRAKLVIKVTIRER
jgi:hypothetical protein